MSGNAKHWIEALTANYPDGTNGLQGMPPGDRYALAAQLYQAAGELSAFVPDALDPEGEPLDGQRVAEWHLWSAVAHGTTALLDALAALEDVIDRGEVDEEERR